MSTCGCGCGETTLVSTYTCRRDGRVRGQHLRFVKGHNTRVAADGTTFPTTEARFWNKVDRRGPNDCWPWLASTNQKGYGHIWIDGRYEQAHRYAYELLVGAIPAGLHIDHLCRNTKCVNPAHMEPVTLAENNRRKHAATRNQEGITQS